MKDYTRNLMVGLTAIAGLVGLAVILVLFGYMPEWLEDGYPVVVEFEQNGGLAPGNRVQLNGIDIGKVDSVVLKEPVTAGVAVIAIIEENRRIPARSKVRIKSPLIGGSPTMLFEATQLPAGEEIAYLPTDGTATIEGDAGGMFSELQNVMAGPMENLDALTENFESLSEEWRAVGVNLRQLTEPRDLDNVKPGGENANLASVLQRTDARLAEMQTVLDGFNRWVNDEQLQTDVRSTVAQARELTEKFSARADQAEEIMTEVRAMVAETRQTIGRTGEQFEGAMERYVGVADELSASIGSMQTVLRRVEQGEGTLGKLINDPEAYHNLNESLSQLEQAIIDVRLLVRKWRDEGLPVRF